MRLRWLPLVVIALGLGLPARAHAQGTYLAMTSEPGDYIGQGHAWLLQPSDGTFMAQRNFANGVSVSFFGAGSSFWFLDFAAPNHVDLAPGMYDGATRYPFQSFTGAGLDVSGEGRGCNVLSGRFVVLEAVYGAVGEVISFAADFEQHCENGDPALFGSIRYNSSVSATPRLSVSSVSVQELDGGTSLATVHVSLSGPAALPVSVAYQTVAGTATPDLDYQSVIGTVVFQPGETVATVAVPIVADVLDEADETFRVVLSAAVNAPIAFGDGVVTIIDDDPEKTLIYFDSDPGDYIGEGVIRRFAPSDGTFTASAEFGAVRILFSGDESWGLSFSAPGPALPTPGVYEDATRWPFQEPGEPGLDVSGDGRGCNALTGRFVVLEAVYGPGPSVDRFAADFEQHCEGQPPALLGSVRYNSLIPAAAVSTRPVLATEAPISVQVHVTLSWPAAQAVTVGFQTSDGTAVAGQDYVPVSGTLTFAPGETQADIEVPLVGDGHEEIDQETFNVDLGPVTGASVLRGRSVVTIEDDDPRHRTPLAHGSVHVGSLEYPNLDGDFYRTESAPYTSWEAVVDATSGDIGDANGVRLRIVNNLNQPIVESEAVGTGPSRTLRLVNSSSITIDGVLQVQSASCSSTCGADDTYRIRYYETTGSIPRFNLGPGRQSVLILQNPTNRFVSAVAVFWNATGTRIAERTLVMGAHASAITNLSTIPELANQSGSITVIHFAPYGTLAGKLVTLETDTGFSFDTPMTTRPR